jgi:nitric oxide reductase activation protein
VGVPAYVHRHAGGTPDYEAIVCATDRLTARDVQRRLLIVFTDGSGAGREAIKHACARAAKRGVDVIGIGIACRDAECYPHHAIVNDLSQLTGATLRKIVDVVVAERRKRGDA